MIGEHILFRPPGEADSLIIHVADGCPWNRCTFYGMYKGVKYKFFGMGKMEAEVLRLCQKMQEDCVIAGTPHLLWELFYVSKRF